MMMRTSVRRILCVSVGMVLGASMTNQADTTSARIVYTCGNGICKVKDDGMYPTRLTDPESAVDFRPSICPSGRAIVFERTLGFEIYRINPTGGAETNLTNSPAYEGDPDCATYGSNTYVLFVSDLNNVNDIFRMDVNGGNRAQLTNNSAQEGQPTWCGSSRVAFARHDGHDWEIFTMDVSNGGNELQITNNEVDDQEPSCSPSTQYVVFSRDPISPLTGHIDIFRVDLTDLPDPGTNMTEHEDTDFDALDPTYSSGGTSLAFAGAEDGSNFNIYKMLAEPGEPKEDVTSDSADETQPDWGELVE